MIALSYQPPLVEGRLVSRYQRFFADVELAGGLGTVTAHCPNPGSMASCMEPGGRVWVQRKTGGKLDWGWELAEVSGVMISVNPTRSNALVAAALEGNAIPELSGYGKVRREADAGDSRLDFLLIKGAKNKERCFVEVKTVTMAGATPDQAIFPDSVTERGVRHLDELRALRKQGFRTALLFVIARGAAHRRQGRRRDPRLPVRADAGRPHLGRQGRRRARQGQVAPGLGYDPRVSWVSDAVDALRAGQVVTVRPRGHSMRGRIEDGQAVTLAPTTPDEVGVGDVVLVRWKGNVLLHRVYALDPERVQIGNNLGKVNGWVAWADVLGRAVDV